MHFWIRAARADDALGICELNKMLGYAGEESEIRERLKHLCSDSNHHIAVAVSSDGGHVMGWIVAELRLILESGYRVDIIGLIVSASVRRLGVGRTLISGVEDWARHFSVKRVRVNCNLTRNDAHLFYSHLDYREIKRQAAFLKHL